MTTEIIKEIKKAIRIAKKRKLTISCNHGTLTIKGKGLMLETELTEALTFKSVDSSFFRKRGVPNIIIDEDDEILVDGMPTWGTGESIKPIHWRKTNTINFSIKGMEVIERIVRINKEVSLLFSNIDSDSIKILARTDTVESEYIFGFGGRSTLFSKQFNGINLGAVFSIEKRIVSISNGIAENGIDVIEIVTPSTKILLEVAGSKPTTSSIIERESKAWHYMGRVNLNSSNWNIYNRDAVLTFVLGDKVEIYQSTLVSQKRVFGAFLSKPDAELYNTKVMVATGDFRDAIGWKSSYINIYINRFGTEMLVFDDANMQSVVKLIQQEIN